MIKQKFPHYKCGILNSRRINNAPVERESYWMSSIWKVKNH